MAFKDLIAGKKKQDDEKELDRSSNKEERPISLFPLDILKDLKSDLKGYINLLPKLDEKRGTLEKEIDNMQEEITKTDDTLQELTAKRNNLEIEIKNRITELHAIENIKGILDGLT